MPTNPRIATGLALTLTFVLALLSARGLMSARVLDGHDALVSLPRLVEFDDSLRAGILAPRWAPHLGAGHGEPVWIFAPPLFQAVCEAFHLAGAPFILSENLALIALLCFAAGCMFLIGLRTGGRWSALAASASFLFAPYVLLQLYVRHAASEFTALCFLPLILLAFLILPERPWRGSFLLACGIAAVGFAHNAGLLITFPIVVAVSIALGWRDRRVSMQAAAGCLAGLATSAWSWLPAMLEKRFVRVDELRKGYFYFGNHFATLRQIVWSPWGFGHSQPGPHDPLSFSVGPVLLLIAALGVVAGMREKRMRGVVLLAAATGLAAILFSTSATSLIWQQVQSLQYLAFPWRFLIIPSVVLPFLAACAAQRWPASTLFLVAVHVWMYAPHANPRGYLLTTNGELAPARIATRGILDTSADEYRPRWAEGLLPFSDMAFVPPVPGIELEYLPIRRSYELVAPRSLLVQMQLFYFPGWTVSIDGQEAAIRPQLHTGLIEFVLPAGRHRVTAEFGPTPDRAAASFPTILGTAGILLMALRARRETG